MINEQENKTNLNSDKEQNQSPTNGDSQDNTVQNQNQENSEEKKLSEEGAQSQTNQNSESSMQEKANEELANTDENENKVETDEKTSMVEEESKPAVIAAPVAVKPKVKKSSSAGEKKWYVVRAISGKENKVKLYIEQEINRLGLDDYVSQVLIPKEKVYQIKAGKKVSKERNYFPGYVLVEANLVGEIPHIIESTTGVIGFLASKGQAPAPLRASEVNRILGKVDELAESEEMINVPYVIGETVKVTDGPFNSFSGIIEEVNEEKKKLKVMVKIFGRKTPLELGYLQVEKE